MVAIGPGGRSIMASGRNALRSRGHARRAAAIGVVLALVLSTGCTDSAGEDGGGGGAENGGGGGGQTYTEPVVLSPEDGVLEVRLRAGQGAAELDTVDQPVEDFLLFGYEIITGASSNGERSAANVYPGPTLNVSPGQTLIVHLENSLTDLTVEDFYDPAFTPAGEDVPLYPPQLVDAPFNLHTHGLHVSPLGNSDNVLLDIPSGMTNTYRYDIPEDHPQGMYWYHSHRHMLTAPQTYQGLSGLLIIGRADGNLPAVTQNSLPVRTMAIQYNYVFDRKGGRSKLNNANWPQYVSTLDPPDPAQLADGTYTPTLTPLNFAESAPGTTFFTNWWAGPLSVNNDRGQFQFLPSNLQGFTDAGGQPTGTVIEAPEGTDPASDAAPESAAASVEIPVDPSLPDDQRDVQFTVNGQFQPTIETKPGQTEIWVLANISDFAYVNLQLTETATGKPTAFTVVGQDGNPYEQVQRPATGDGTTLLLPPATRYAVAVTMPEEGGLVLEMPPLDGLTDPMTSEGVLYTNDGTDSPPAVLGTVTVPPESVSYVDGFFAFPTQALARVEPAEGSGTSVDFTPGQPLGAYTSFVDTQGVDPAVQRTLVISGGFTNTFANSQDPKAFVYQFDDNAFPYIPLIQPRLNTVEEWTIVNENNDEHPIHIHVNDFQVSRVVDPVAGVDRGFQPWGQDNINVPAPAMDADGNVTTPGSVSLRTKFAQFTGTYVIHCHRLNHEDNGLMAIVNVIPEISSYAVAAAGAPGTPATVEVLDAANNTSLATVTPFPGSEGQPEVATADIDGDGVLDLIAAEGPGGRGEVVAYSGAARPRAQPFTYELARFTAFEGPAAVGGLRLAADLIDGNSRGAANIVVASGPGAEGQVKVFATELSPLGEAPAVFSTFTPYPGVTTGVELATGMVDMTSGRASIITAPGPGTPATVAAWRYDLYTPNGTGSEAPDRDGLRPAKVGEVQAFDNDYTDGVSLSAGWLAGGLGGVQRIVVAQRGEPGQVVVLSSGSALDGQPELYTQPLSHDGHGALTLSEVARFTPFGTAPDGVRVTVTSTTSGADLLVSGVDSGTAQIRRFELTRPEPTATTLVPTPIGDPVTAPGRRPPSIGGR